MGEIEWAMWANEQAVIGAVVLLIGSVIGVAAFFKNWQFAAFAIPASLVILFMEYPRGKRRKGSTMERRFQQYLTPVINKMGPLTKNYYVRFLIQLLFSVPCCFLLPTIMGGMCLMLSAAIYLVAALKGESWMPVMSEKKYDKTDGGTVVSSDPPTYPPPRLPTHRAAAAQDVENEVGHLQAPSSEPAGRQARY